MILRRIITIIILKTLPVVHMSYRQLSIPLSLLTLLLTFLPSSLAQLRLSPDNTFKLLQFADLHEGEGPDSWGSATDARTESFLARAITSEKPDLVVFSGDQITGLNVFSNATKYYQRLSDLVDPTPHTMILGNHDAEPYDGNGDQSDPGALTTRADLIAFDSSQPNSYSKLGPESLLPAVSTYVVDVLAAHDDSVALQLVHLDSGGGGMHEEVQVRALAICTSHFHSHSF